MTCYRRIAVIFALCVGAPRFAHAIKMRGDDTVLSEDNQNFNIYATKKNIISLEGNIGGIMSPVFTAEDAFIGSQNLRWRWSDGQTETFSGSRLFLGAGINYERMFSRNIGFRGTYIYGLMNHTISVGDGKDHDVKSTGGHLFRTHGFLFGGSFKMWLSRAHAIILDIPLQIGVNSSTYYPLVTYSQARSDLGYSLSTLSAENAATTSWGFRARAGIFLTGLSPFSIMYSSVGAFYDYSTNGGGFPLNNNNGNSSIELIYFQYAVGVFL